MTHRTALSLPRPAALAVLIALVVVALPACTTGGDAAREVAQRHVQLVATGTAEQAEELWRTTLTDRPTELRQAGATLLGASERITVLGIGDPAPVDGPVDIASSAGLDADAAVTVSVRYSLAGTEYDAVLVLAPRRDHPRGEPGSWRVTTPLLGELSLAPGTTGNSVPADLYVGERRLSPRDLITDPVPLYPAVYPVQRRSDPYLSSAVAPLAVGTDEGAQFPELQMEATDDARTALVAEAGTVFASWHAKPYLAPDVVTSRVRASHPAAYRSGDWTFEMTESPTNWQVEGNQLRFDGGTAVLGFPDGTTQTVEFAGGTATWVIDNQTWTPRLIPTRVRLEVAS